MTLAKEQSFHSIVFPFIGAGSGGFNADEALHVMP
jgi:hypothetical protein